MTEEVQLGLFQTRVHCLSFQVSFSSRCALRPFKRGHVKPCVLFSNFSRELGTSGSAFGFPYLRCTARLYYANKSHSWKLVEHLGAPHEREEETRRSGSSSVRWQLLMWISRSNRTSAVDVGPAPFCHAERQRPLPADGPQEKGSGVVTMATWCGSCCCCSSGRAGWAQLPHFSELSEPAGPHPQPGPSRSPAYSYSSKTMK